MTETPHADTVADMVLPVDGPYPPDRVVEAARTMSELVRRLNHATRHASALRYPPHAHRTIGAVRSALYGLDQTFTQIATRLDGFAADPQVEHDDRGDPWADSAEAAHHLRHAADALREVNDALDRVTAITFHLGYTTTTMRPRQQTFLLPGPTTSVHKGQTAGTVLPFAPRGGRTDDGPRHRR